MEGKSALFRGAFPAVAIDGPAGAGKSTVGREVARRLGRPFVDMDAEIASRAGKPIPRIFAEEGEGVFREMEHALCRELSSRSGHVIATGGGALVDAANRDLWSGSATLICLHADLDEILHRVGEGTDRPLLTGTAPRAEARRLLTERQAAYTAIPWQVDTTGRSPDEVVDEVLNLEDIPGGIVRRCRKKS